jgi:hypothetical protein
MLASDSSDEWDETVMPDLRVQHFWDTELEAAQWFARHVDGYEGVAWDVYYLYGPEAIWETIPDVLISSGGTIYRERQTLKAQVSTLLGK